MRVHLTFNGEPIEAPEDATVAAALVAAGHDTWRTTGGGKRRGLFCGIGVCYDCLITIAGRSERACMVQVREGMEVTDHDPGS